MGKNSVLPLMMGKHSLIGKGFALLVTSAFLFTNGLFAHSSEKKFWTERRQAIEKSRHSSDFLQVAGLPGNLSSGDPIEILTPKIQLAAFFRPQGQNFFVRHNVDGSPVPTGESRLKQATALPKEVSPSLSKILAKSLPSDFLTTHKRLFEALPLSLGTVRSVALPEGAPKFTVLHIQDVHLNQEAQENIAGVVRSLTEKKVASVLALEGAWGPLDFSAFRSFHDPAAVRWAADYLLRQKRITGPVHASCTGPIDFPVVVGVDDETQYHANVNAYIRSASARKDIQNTLTEARRRLDAQKPNVFNQALLKFDRKVEGYHEGKGKLGDYVKAISIETPDKKLFPSIAAFLSALRMEEAMDFKQVERERTELIQNLAKALKPFQLGNLLGKSMAYRSGQLRYSEFYPYLRNLCAESGVSLKKFPAMDDYIRYVLASDHINADDLFKELNQMEEFVYDKLSKTLEERSLVSKSHRLLLTSKLVDFSLTTEEWKEYKVISKGVSTNSLDLTSFESFYKNAIARDESMAQNLLRQMELTGLGSKSANRVGVLVTGGFHSEGIATQLKNSGAAVVSFVPKIANVGTDGSEYLSVFTQEKAPLEKLFSGETLFLGISQVESESHIQQQLALIVALIRARYADADTIPNQVEIVEWDKANNRVKVLVKGGFNWVRLQFNASNQITGLLVTPDNRSRAINHLRKMGKDISEWAIAKTVVYRGWETKDFLFHPIRFFGGHKNRSVGERIFRGATIFFGFSLSWGLSIYPIFSLMDVYVFPMNSLARVAASVIVGGPTILLMAYLINQVYHLIVDWLVIYSPRIYKDLLKWVGVNSIDKEIKTLKRVMAEGNFLLEFSKRCPVQSNKRKKSLQGFKVFAESVYQICQRRHHSALFGSERKSSDLSEVLWDILDGRTTESEQKIIDDNFGSKELKESQKIMAELALHRMVPPVLVANGNSNHYTRSIGDEEPLDPKHDGEKAYHLGVLSQLGIKNPPGFALLPSFYKEDYKQTNSLAAAWDQVLVSLSRLEQKTGQGFGNEQNPLLLSVRSNAGEEESMPGLMKTIVNVGLNKNTFQGLVKRGGERFAQDTLRRFIRSYATAVFDIPDEEFYLASTDLLQEFHVSGESLLPAEGLARLVEKYRSILSEHGRVIPEDIHQQLQDSLNAVLNSFNSEGARIFKEVRGLNDTGMGAIVQQVVFGNLNNSSGTGVVYTRNRKTGENILDGQYGLGIQGEDVVAGRREPGLKDIDQLKIEMPEVFDSVVKIKSLVERRFRWPQDLEFTIQNGELFVLQTRKEEMSPEALLLAGEEMIEEKIIENNLFMRIKAAKMAQARPFYRLRKGIDEEIIMQGVSGTPGAQRGRMVLSENFDPSHRYDDPVVLVESNPNAPAVLKYLFSPQVCALLTVEGQKVSHAVNRCQISGMPSVMGIPGIRRAGNKLHLPGDIEILEGAWVVVDGSRRVVLLTEETNVLVPSHLIEVASLGLEDVERIEARIKKRWGDSLYEEVLEEYVDASKSHERLKEKFPEVSQSELDIANVRLHTLHLIAWEKGAERGFSHARVNRDIGAMKEAVLKSVLGEEALRKGEARIILLEDSSMVDRSEGKHPNPDQANLLFGDQIKQNRVKAEKLRQEQYPAYPLLETLRCVETKYHDGSGARYFTQLFSVNVPLESIEDEQSKREFHANAQNMKYEKMITELETETPDVNYESSRRKFRNSYVKNIITIDWWPKTENNNETSLSFTIKGPDHQIFTLTEESASTKIKFVKGKETALPFQCLRDLFKSKDTVYLVVSPSLVRVLNINEIPTFFSDGAKRDPSYVRLISSTLAPAIKRSVQEQAARDYLEKDSAVLQEFKLNFWDPVLATLTGSQVQALIKLILHIERRNFSQSLPPFLLLQFDLFRKLVPGISPEKWEEKGYLEGVKRDLLKSVELSKPEVLTLLNHFHEGSSPAPILNDVFYSNLPGLFLAFEKVGAVLPDEIKPMLEFLNLVRYKEPWSEDGLFRVATGLFLEGDDPVPPSPKNNGPNPPSLNPRNDKGGQAQADAMDMANLLKELVRNNFEPLLNKSFLTTDQPLQALLGGRGVGLAQRETIFDRILKFQKDPAYVGPFKETLKKELGKPGVLSNSHLDHLQARVVSLNRDNLASVQAQIALMGTLNKFFGEIGLRDHGQPLIRTIVTPTSHEAGQAISQLRVEEFPGNYVAIPNLEPGEALTIPKLAKAYGELKEKGLVVPGMTLVPLNRMDNLDRDSLEHTYNTPLERKVQTMADTAKDLPELMRVSQSIKTLIEVLRAIAAMA